MSTDRFVVWSIEYQSWCPGVATVAEAGRFSRDDAAAIVARANREIVQACMLPLEAVTTDPASPSPVNPAEQLRRLIAFTHSLSGK
jgi:hypothetical protein